VAGPVVFVGIFVAGYILVTGRVPRPR
jgi:hypothetical protein